MSALPNTTRPANNPFLQDDRGLCGLFRNITATEPGQWMHIFTAHKQLIPDRCAAIAQQASNEVDIAARCIEVVGKLLSAANDEISKEAVRDTGYLIQHLAGC